MGQTPKRHVAKLSGDQSNDIEREGNEVGPKYIPHTYTNPSRKLNEIPGHAKRFRDVHRTGSVRARTDLLRKHRFLKMQVAFGTVGILRDFKGLMGRNSKPPNCKP